MKTQKLATKLVKSRCLSTPEDRVKPLAKSNHRVLPLLNLSVFIASLGFASSIYMIPVFAQSFGASYLDLGIIGTVRAIPYAFLPVLVGFLANKLNRARFYLLSLAFNALSTGLLAVAGSVFDIIVIQIIGGIGFALFWPSSETLVTDVTPVNGRVKAIGRYSVAWAVGFLLGPLIGGYLLEMMGFILLFTLSAGIVVVSTIISTVTILPRYVPLPNHRGKAGMERPSLSGSYPIYAAIIPYSIIFAVVVAIFPGYANSIGVSSTEIGVLFSVFGVTRAAAFLFSERFARIGEKRALTLVAVILFGSLLIIYSTLSTWGFALALALTGLSLGIFFPLTLNAVSQRFPRERLGTAIGLYEATFGVGFAIGPVIGGALAELWTPTLPYLALSFLGLTIIPLVNLWKS